jgi:hypothetical protein
MVSRSSQQTGASDATSFDDAYRDIGRQLEIPGLKTIKQTLRDWLRLVCSRKVQEIGL